VAPGSRYVRKALTRLKDIRRSKAVTPTELDDALILGPGWTEHFEEGKALPSLDVLAAILGRLGSSLQELGTGLPSPAKKARIDRLVYAEQQGKDLAVRFRYAEHDATYVLPNATQAQFAQVLRTLRNGLALLANASESQGKAVKTDAVATSFLHAVRVWPHANPSDIWYFIIYRAYCDPYNHPALFSRLDFEQSWKRTGGWALEEVLVRHYGPHLAKHGIRLFIADTASKRRMLGSTSVSDRLEADKIDVLLTGIEAEREVFFGVIHVKASFAERRTDDVPMSSALVGAGYASPLWTMDCKCTPGPRPVNRGELGKVLRPGQKDGRSAKRKDIEDDGYFSACFSYNSNTQPTPSRQKAKARVTVCDFNHPQDDPFVRFIADRCQVFQRENSGSS